MKIISQIIRLTDEQVKELEEIDDAVLDSPPNAKGIVLAQINPSEIGKFPKTMKVSFFPDRAASAIVGFMNLLAEVIGHYEKEEDDGGE